MCNVSFDRRSGWGLLASLLLWVGLTSTAHAGYTNHPDPQGKPCMDPPCCSCPGSGPGGGSGPTGMPTYHVNPMLIGLVLHDTPLAYQPPVGPAINFSLTYHQKDQDQPATPSFGNFGPKWAFNWLEYIVDDPADTGSNVMVYLPYGIGRDYDYDSATGTFAMEPESGAVLVRVSTSPVIYERRFPDGSKEVFSTSDGSTSYPRRIFLTRRIGPHGNAVSLTYDSQNRLTGITDAAGQTSTLYYEDATHPLRVTKISDPFGRSATFAYDGNGRLASITDAIGMTSSFGYASATRIGSLTTPYGTTSFDYGESGYHYWLNITDVNGNLSRWEFRQDAPGILYSSSHAPNGMPTFNRYLDGRNSFHWDAYAYAQAAGDYTQATIFHWQHKAGVSGTTSDALESIKYPLQRRTWNAYPGGSGGTSGTLNRPAYTGRVLPDGTTQLTTHEYNDRGNVTKLVDGAGLQTVTAYATNGVDPITITYTGPNGYQASESYTYNDQHQPLTHTDEMGAVTTYTYNAAGQVTSAEDPLGHTRHYHYDSNGYLTSLTDANGNTTTYTYDAMGRKTTETDPLGNTKTFTYDALNRVTRITYWDGSYEENTWDKLDRVAHRDRNGNTTHYQYDNMRNLVKITDPLGHETTFTYYPNNLLHTRTEPDGGVTTWTRDIQGRVIAREGPNDNTTTFTYGAIGRKTSKTNALGQTVEYLAWDGANRLTRTKNSNGVIIDVTYNARGWPIERTIRAYADGTPSPDDATTTMTYNDNGDLLSVTEPDGTILGFTYDAAHRLTRIDDNMGNYIVYTLDAVGNRTATETYTANNVLTRSTTRTFDARNQVLTQSDGEGNTTTFDYDADGKRTYRTDPLGVTTHWNYDPVGRLLTTVRDQRFLFPASDTANTTTSYQYDAANHLVAVIDPGGLATQYQVDAMGRITQLTSPDTGVTTYAYDVAGNRTSQTDARGVTSNYSYDALNRLTSISYPDASENVTWRYDSYLNQASPCVDPSWPVGHVTVMTSQTGRTTYCYDRRGNVTEKIQVTSGRLLVTRYRWNLADRLMGITYPSGTVVSYARDADGRIQRVSVITPDRMLPVTVIADVNWQPFGPPRRFAFGGGGQVLTKTHDHNYRVTDVTSNVLDLHFCRDAMGNITKLASAGPACGQPARETYQYDDLYRLTEIDAGNGSPRQAFTYNQTGDRLSKTLGVLHPPQIYSYAPGSHHLVTAGASQRQFDANGNTVQITGQTTLDLTYNDRNRLVRAERLRGTRVATYGYNAVGERVYKHTTWPNTEGRRFTYAENGRLLGEYTPGKAKAYIWVGRVPVALVITTGSHLPAVHGTPTGYPQVATSSTIYYIHSDQLNTPRAVTTQSGNMVWSWRWENNAFGDKPPAATFGGVTLNLRFPGQYFDAVSGLNYNYYRDYESVTGRYVESDTIGLIGGVNTYTYVANNPFVYDDEDGRRKHSGGTGRDHHKTPIPGPWRPHKNLRYTMVCVEGWCSEGRFGVCTPNRVSRHKMQFVGAPPTMYPGMKSFDWKYPNCHCTRTMWADLTIDPSAPGADMYDYLELIKRLREAK